MQRFTGQILPSKARIAVLANDAIGNYVVTTPLMQMLRNKYPDAELIYIGGYRTKELQESSDLANRSLLVLGSPNPIEEVRDLFGTCDLAINVEQTPITKVLCGLLAKNGYVCGPCMGIDGRGELEFGEDSLADLWRDNQWMAESIVQRYPFLQSPFIGEIFCRLAYLEGAIPAYRLPYAQLNQSIPDVIISASASLKEKLWNPEFWHQTLAEISANHYSIGIVGAKPTEGSKHWLGVDIESQLVKKNRLTDLRGKLTLPQVVTALQQAKLILTIDNGILHLACGSGTPTVGLYRYGIHRLWAPPQPCLAVLHPGPHSPVNAIPVEAVLAAISNIL